MSLKPLFNRYGWTIGHVSLVILMIVFLAACGSSGEPEAIPADAPDATKDVFAASTGGTVYKQPPPEADDSTAVSSPGSADTDSSGCNTESYEAAAAAGYGSTGSEEVVIYLTDTDPNVTNYIEMSFVDDLGQSVSLPKSFYGDKLLWQTKETEKKQKLWNWSNLSKQGGNIFKFAYSGGFMVELELDQVVNSWDDLLDSGIEDVRKDKWGGSASKYKIGIDKCWRFVLKPPDLQPGQ